MIQRVDRIDPPFPFSLSLTYLSPEGDNGPVAHLTGKEADPGVGGRAWSAVVLYYRSPGTIHETLKGLLAQDLPPQEVLVVDNNSRDQLGERLSAEFSGRVTLVTCAQNVGYAAGMNTGRQHLQGRPGAVMFVTHEVRLAPTCARLLLDGMAAGGLTIAGPSLTLPSGEPWSFGGHVGWRGNVWHDTRCTDASIQRCAWVDGSVVMADLAAFDALGGYDPTFFLYWEDVDLGIRAGRLQSGPTVGCVTAARASQDTKMAPERLSVRGRLRMWRLHGDWLRLIFSIVDVAGRIIVRDLLGGRPKVALERLSGLREGLSVLPTPDPVYAEVEVQRPL